MKHESAPADPPSSTEPKVVVVGGAATHPGGGPSHNLYSPGPSSPFTYESEVPRKVPASNVGKLFADMADDLGLPTTFKLSGSGEAEYDVAAKTETSGAQGKKYSRTLDEEEKQGLWVLFGLFAGSFVAASVFAPVSEWAHKAEKKAADVEEKTVGKKH